MSKNRYLHEDMRDLAIARDKLADALLEALKPVIRALIWLLERPYVLIVVLSFWCAIVVTLMILYR